MADPTDWVLKRRRELEAQRLAAEADDLVTSTPVYPVAPGTTSYDALSVQREPVDVDNARLDAQEALRKAGEVRLGNTYDALEWASRSQADAPPPIPAKPSLAQVAERALSPLQIVRDERDPGLMARVKATGGRALEMNEALFRPALDALVGLQTATRDLPDTEVNADTPLPERFRAGLTRGVKRAGDALVPDALVEQYDNEGPSSMGEIGRALEALGAGQEPLPGSGPIPGAGEFDLDTLRRGILNPEAGPSGWARSAQVVGKALQAPEAMRETVLGAPRHELEDDVEGAPAENMAMWAMRVLGTVPEAGVLTMAENTTVPVPQRLLDGPSDDDNVFVRLLTDATPRLTRSGDLLGLPSGTAAGTEVDGAVDGAVRDFFGRVERGEGAEVDLAKAAGHLLGPEWASTGYAAGLLASMGFNWESVLLAPAGKLGKLASRARALGHVSEASLLERTAAAFEGSTVSMADTIGSQLAEQAAGGKALPTEVKAFADRVARDIVGASFDEVRASEGFAPMPAMDEAQSTRLAAGDVKPEDSAPVGLRPPELPASAVTQVVPRFEDLNNLAPGNQYVLRNKVGAVVRIFTDLDEAIGFMHQRGWEGDQLWRSGLKPIVTWGSVPIKEVLRPDGSMTWMKADPSQRVLQMTRGAGSGDLTVGEKLLKQPKIREARALRSFTDAKAAATGKAIVDLSFGRRSKGRRPVARRQPSPPDAEVGMPGAPEPGQVQGPMSLTEHIVREATALWARDKLGADEVAILPTGAVVSHGDRRRILASLDKDLSDAGLGRGDDQRVLGGAKLSYPSTVEVLQAKYGTTADPSTPTGLRELREAGMRYHGGRLADARMGVKGQPRFAQRLVAAIATTGAGRRWEPEALRTALDTGANGWTVRAFVDGAFGDPTAGLGESQRAALLRVRSLLERAPDEVMGELDNALAAYREEVGRGTFEVMTQDEIARVMHATYLPHRTVKPAQAKAAALIDATLAPPDGRPLTSTDVFAARDQVLTELPEWARNATPEVTAAALRRWSDSVHAKMREDGRELMAQLYATAGKTVKTHPELVKFMTVENFEAVYRELVLEGQPTSPTFDAIEGNRTTARLRPGQKAVDYNVAILGFLVNQRRRDLLNQGFRDLLAEGLLITSDEKYARSHQALTPLTESLERVASGNAWTTAPDGTRTYHMTEAEATWAEQTLLRMGVEPGSDQSLSTVKLGGAEGPREFRVPRYLEQALVQAMTSGKVDTLGAALEGGLLGLEDRLSLQALLRTWKASATHGLLLPRPSYNLGQTLSALQLQSMFHGFAAAAGATPAVVGSAILPPFIQKPGMTGEILKRLASDEFQPKFRAWFPPAEYLRTVDGTLYHIDELATAAREYGLADTIVAFETAPSIKRLVSEQNSRLGRLRMPVRVWNQLIRDWAGSIDQANRVSTFLREVERGATFGDAAKTARTTALDFRNLTPAEVRTIRHGFTFYAYMRKSVDAAFLAYMQNPGRVGKQLRMAHWMATDERTDVQRGQVDSQDVARLRPGKVLAVLLGRSWRGDVEDTQPRSVAQDKWAWSTPSVGISAPLSTLMLLLDPDEALQSMNPITDAASVGLLGRRRLVGAAVDEPDSVVTVPPLLAEGLGPISATLRSVLDVGPAPMGTFDDPALAGVEPSIELGSPAKWAAGAGMESQQNPGSTGTVARKRAAAITNILLGPFVRNTQDWWNAATAAGNPNLGELEEAAFFLLGLKLRPEITTTEAEYQATKAIERSAGDVETATQTLLPR